MSVSIKKRHWAFVLYPDSAPSNWREILALSGISYAISPFHDKDIDPTGDPKKPHYHIILSWVGPTTFKSAVEFSQGKLNGTIPIDLESPLGMFRYFTHRDNPDKYQYDNKEIVCGGGFDPLQFEILSFSATEEVLNSIIEDICEYDITEYSSLIEYYYFNNDKIKTRVARTNTTFLNSYLTSRRYRIKSKRNIGCE